MRARACLHVFVTFIIVSACCVRHVHAVLRSKVTAYEKTVWLKLCTDVTDMWTDELTSCKSAVCSQADVLFRRLTSVPLVGIVRCRHMTNQYNVIIQQLAKSARYVRNTAQIAS